MQPLKKSERMYTSERIVEAVRYLIYKGIVKNKRAFCDRVKVTKANYSYVEKGLRHFPSRKIINVVDEFGVSVDFIYHGKRPILAHSNTHVKNNELVND
jgi:hypothetical protein